MTQGKVLTFYFNLFKPLFWHKICRTQRPWSSCPLSSASSSPPNCSKWRNFRSWKGESKQNHYWEGIYLCCFLELLASTSENRDLHKTLGFFQMVSGGSGSTAAITSGWLEGWNPTYQVFRTQQGQIDKLDFIKIIKLLCFKGHPEGSEKNPQNGENFCKSNIW